MLPLEFINLIINHAFVIIEKNEAVEENFL